MKYSKCQHSAGLQNSTIFLMLFSFTVLWTLSTADFWHLLCTGDTFLNRVCNLKVACLISLKRVQRKFLPTATIKYKNQTAAISSAPVRKQMVDLYGRIFLSYSYYTEHQQIFFLKPNKGHCSTTSQFLVVHLCFLCPDDTSTN